MLTYPYSFELFCTCDVIGFGVDYIQIKKKTQIFEQKKNWKSLNQITKEYIYYFRTSNIYSYTMRINQNNSNLLNLF